jgi:enoyl-CoA hydratase/carnithine racemase
MSEVNEIVSIARRGAVAVLTINRPPVNALG